MQGFPLHRTQKLLNIPEQLDAESNNRDSSYKNMDGNKYLMKAKPIQLTKEISISSHEKFKSVNSLVSLSSDWTMGSIDILNEVWIDSRHYEKTLPRVSKLAGLSKHFDIDWFYSGYKGKPNLEDKDARLKFKQLDIAARRFKKLTKERQTYEIIVHMRELQWLKDQTKKNFYSKLMSNKVSNKISVTKVTQVLHECPMHMSGCARLLNEGLLAHFLKLHSESGVEAVSRVNHQLSMLIKFNPRKIEMSRNVCLAIIVHTGIRFFFNAGLVAAYDRYTEHLPILVMASRTRLKVDKPKIEGSVKNHNQEQVYDSSQFKSFSRTCPNCDYESRDEFLGNEIGENVLAIWMVSVEQPQPIYVHMMAYNQRMDVCRSSVGLVRHLSSNHKIDKFLPSTKNYLRLSEQDLRMLTNHFEEPIYLEFSIWHSEFANI